MVVGNPVLGIGLFAAFVAATLVVALRAGRRDEPAVDHDPSVGGPRNGVPIAGEQLCAVAFVGIVGAVAVHGHDAFLYAFGFLVAWLMALSLIAELVRHPGRFSGAQVLSVRLQERSVRSATASATVTVSFFLLLAQTVAAATLVTVLLQIPATDTLGRSVVMAGTGAVMIVYGLVGGVRPGAAARIGTACLLMLCSAVLVAWVMGNYGWNVSALMNAAAHPGGRAAGPSGTQLLAGLSWPSKIDLLSGGLALVLGAGALPHVLRRLSMAPDSGGTRRRSVVWTVGLIGLFCLFALVAGYGAATLVPGGAQGIAAAVGASDAAAPLLAYELGGVVLLALVSAVAFATILDAAAGLTITASVAFAHDVHAGRILRARAADEVRVARRTAVLLGVAAVGVGILARNQNVALLVALAFAVAASANLPTLLLSLFWRPFTDRAARWSTYGGLSCCVVLILLSPTVSGQPTSMFPGVDVALFPLANPGLVSIPLSFVLGVTVTGLEGLRRSRALARIAAEQAALDRDPPTQAIPYDAVARLHAARQMYQDWPAAGPAHTGQDVTRSPPR